MKKSLHYAMLLLLALLTINLNAQYCGSTHPLGSNICTPDPSFTTVGFSPPYNNLPCAVAGVPYGGNNGQVIQFHAPATVTQGSTTYTLNYITIDTVNNLPCGLCWSGAATDNRIQASSTGCIAAFGTTYDKPGQYKIHVIVDANVEVGIFPVNVTNQDAAALGLKYFVRVQLPGDTCITVDSNAVGNFTNTGGSIGTPVISGASTVCSGSTTTLGVTGGNYYGYAWSNGKFTPTISVGAGIYTVTVYGACTTATATKTVGSSSVSVTATPGGPTTFCQGGSVTLDAGSGYSAYSWTGGSTGQTLNVTQTGAYTVTATQNGCSGSSTPVSVTVNGTPSPSITAGGPTTFCQGGSVSLDAGAGYSSYAWSGGATTQSISATADGSYNVTVTQNGCSGSANAVSVTVGNPSPTITPSGPTTFCSGGNVTLDAGAGYSSYSWTGGATTQSINITSGGSYSVTVTQGGCNGTAGPVVVTVGSTLSPSISALPSLTICTGGSTTLDAGAGYDTYAWSGSGATTQTISASAAGAYTVTVTQGSCSGTNTATVVENNAPLTVTVTPAGPVSVCVGTPVSLDAGAGYATYSWTGGSTSETLSPTTSGTYTVSVTQNGCSGSADVSVTFNNPPVPAISPNGPVSACVGGTPVTLDAGAGFSSYAWSNGGTSQTTQPANSNTYTVTVVDNNNCSGTNSVSVTFNPPPTPEILPAGNVGVCNGQTALLNAGNGYDSYSWSNGATTQTITVGTAATYNVTVTQNGCTGSATNGVTITVNTAPTVAVSSSTIGGGLYELDATSSGATGYQWQNVLTDTVNGPFTNVSTDVADTVNCTSAYGYFRVIVSGAGGCTDTSSFIYSAVCTGLNDIKSLTSFTLQPNPANDVITVFYELNETMTVRLSVIDLTGRRVIDVLNDTQYKGDHKNQIRLGNLAPGIYMLNFMTDNGSFNTKFVKQ